MEREEETDKGENKIWIGSVIYLGYNGGRVVEATGVKAGWRRGGDGVGGGVATRSGRILWVPSKPEEKRDPRERNRFHLELAQMVLG